MNNHLFNTVFRKWFVLFIVSLFITNFLFSQGLLGNLLNNTKPVSYIKTEKNRFFSEADQAFVSHFYKLISSDHNLYAWVDGTGRLYKAARFDTGIAFIRQDSTIHFGYNIAAFPFSYQGKIYTLGGYGLWRINGQLRVFNDIDRQWDIVKLNEEVPFIFDSEENLLWYNPTSSSIYLGCAMYRNEAVGQNNTEMDETKLDYTVRRLDLKKMQWEKLGELSEPLKNKPVSTITMSPWGQLILTADKINLIDYARNSILTLDINNKAYQSIVRNRYSSTFYYKDSTLYYGDIRSMKLDSVQMKYADFEPTGQIVYSPLTNKTYTRVLLFTIAGAVFLLLLWSLSKTYKIKLINKKKVQLESKVYVESTLQFDEKELQLLELLVKNSLDKQYTSLDEINHVLGIGKRSLEIQKKQRSDIISSINKKYCQTYSSQENLILKQRADFDKRSFEYYIDASKIDFLTHIFSNQV